MPTSCVLIHCKNSQKAKNESVLSYHAFPSNPHIRNEWISIIRKSKKDDNWFPHKSSGVCSLHFKKEDILCTRDGRQCIRKTALPTLCLSASRSTNTTEDPVEIVTVPEFDPLPENPETKEFLSETEEQMSESSEELPMELQDSDLDSIYDNHIEHNLRNQLRMKQKLTANHKQTLKSLYEQYKSLKKRNFSIRRELNRLKKNMRRNKKK